MLLKRSPLLQILWSKFIGSYSQKHCLVTVHYRSDIQRKDFDTQINVVLMLCNRSEKKNQVNCDFSITEILFNYLAIGYSLTRVYILIGMFVKKNISVQSSSNSDKTLHKYMDLLHLR